MSRTSLAFLTIFATAFILGPTSDASAQRGLDKGLLVQTRYLTDEQRAARGWPTRGGGLTAGVRTHVAKIKRKKRYRARVT